MDETGKSLLKLLFNEGESICPSPNQFAYHSIPLKDVLEKEEILLHSPNEKVKDRIYKTSDLILCALNPIKGFRCDDNATAYRTFLVELDIGTIPEQLGTIEHIKMPYSAQVFSGNKSVHTAITLSEDLKDEKTYRFIAEWIFNIVPKVDDKCKNPSRSIRVPGSRRENGKKQRLINVKKRISQKELMDWLNKYAHLQPRVPRKRVVPKGEADYSRLSPWVCAMLKSGMVFKNGRNQTWFAVAYDFALAGFQEEEIVNELSRHFQPERDFKEKEWRSTITSAFRKVNKDK